MPDDVFLRAACMVHDRSVEQWYALLVGPASLPVLLLFVVVNWVALKYWRTN